MQQAQVHTTYEQQSQAIDKDDSAERWGSADLALLAFAILAVFAYIII